MSPTKAKARPTLKTIANLSGLAVPTVSRALNDAPDIGEATKKRVRSIALEIGYRPNRAGLRLRTGKTNVIALVLSTQHDMMNHTARLITSIAGATRGTPYHMIVTPYFPDQDPMDPVRYVTETGSADGIILNQTEPRDPRVEYLMASNFPFATHGRTDWADQHPYYDFHNGIFSATCVKQLKARGRRRVLLVAPPTSQFYAIELITDATKAAEQHGVTMQLLDTVTSDSASFEIEATTREALRRYPDTDGVICASTNAAMAVVAGLEAEGHTLGQDIDVIAKEAMPFLTRFRKDILTIHEDVANAGEFLCRAIMQAIDHPDLPPMQYLEQPKV
ncbi:MAG: LacI family transcriptional regulator [Pseudomonadota bacterium]